MSGRAHSTKYQEKIGDFDIGTSASSAKIQVKPFKIYFQQSRIVSITTGKHLKMSTVLALKQISENIQAEIKETSTIRILILVYLLLSTAISVSY